MQNAIAFCVALCYYIDTETNKSLYKKKEVNKMSAYIVSNKTISAIVKGFRVYNAAFAAEDYKQAASIIIGVDITSNAMGEALLNQNYKSVNCRYRENNETPKYNYEDVKINEGIVIGALIATSIRLAKRMTISTVKFITHF